MIQRIQSLYLSLTIILPLLFLKGSFLKFINKTGSEFFMNFAGTWQQSGVADPGLLLKQIPLSVIIILIPVVGLAALFTFKNRKLQMKLTSAVILSAVILTGLIIYYAISVININQVEVVPGFKMLIPALIIVFGILALRGIRKDENLVRSYDRLR